MTLIEIAISLVAILNLAVLILGAALGLLGIAAAPAPPSFNDRAVSQEFAAVREGSPLGTGGRSYG